MSSLIKAASFQQKASSLYSCSEALIYPAFPDGFLGKMAELLRLNQKKKENEDVLS